MSRLRLFPLLWSRPVPGTCPDAENTESPAETRRRGERAQSAPQLRDSAAPRENVFGLRSPSLLSCLLAFILLFAAPGCSGDDDDSSSPPGDDTSEPGDDDTSGTGDDDSGDDDSGDDDTTASGDDDSGDDDSGDDDASSANDTDGDGFEPPDDCDDNDPSTHPGAAEACDDRDNDCDGATDEGNTDPAWPDADNDGYGDDSADPLSGCDVPDDYVYLGGDCDDADPTRNPGVGEECDGIDNDCDDVVDEDLNTRTYYPDVDADSYGASTGGVTACERPDGYVSNNDDCDDTDPNTNPLKSERCDGRDNDCDGNADDGLHLDRYYADLDNDGYGDRAAPLISCGVSTGVADDATDCNDTDPDIHPNATERCNGIDDNCSGLGDEGREALDHAGVWYKDQDGDGYGLESSPTYSCTQPSGFVADRGDCDDTKASIHPGADDPAGDGIDQDCGGTADPQPHVGLGAGSTASIQAALSAALPGATVWVGPGTYAESALSFGGRAIILAATRPGAAIVDAGGKGSGFIFATRESSGTKLDGFTVTGGKAKKGGGIYIDNASPTLIRVNVIDNFADEAGGGIYLNASNASLSDLVVAGNVVSNTYTSMLGGGIAVNAASPSISRTVVRENSASEGGGIYSATSNLSLTDCTIAHNRSTTGGGISLPSAIGKSYAVALIRCTIRDNRANDGGGVSLRVSGASLSSCSISANRARDHGGGIYVPSGNPSIANCTVYNNRALNGGGIEFAGASTTATLQNVISAWNDGYNLYVKDATVTLTYSDLYSPVGPNHNLGTLPTTNLEVDPGFISWFHDVTPYNDDDHLASASPLRNKGDPATSNPDGARADIGAYGGVDADRSYYLDPDGDGMYNGWEIAHGLDTKTVDGAKDPDDDGATNAREFYEGADPQDRDTDNDGALDGAEVNAAVDPGDWYAQPGVTGVATAEVPGDFDTVQEAIDAIQAQGKVQLGDGIVQENLVIDSRDLVLKSAHGSSLTTLEADSGTALLVRWSKLQLEGLTLAGGRNDSGGGASLFRTTGTLTDIALIDGYAGHGAGLYTSLAELTLKDVAVTGACADGEFSGALEAVASTLTLEGVSVADSACSSAAKSGGLVLSGAAATITGSSFTGNSGPGVGLYQKAEATFTDSEVSSNLAGGVTISDSPFLSFTGCDIIGNKGGPGLYIYNSDPDITGCTIADNSSSVEGGGLYLFDSAASIVQSVVRGNVGKHGGGIYVESARPTIEYSLIEANSGGNGGGIYITDSPNAKVQHTILRGNTATAGGAIHLAASPSTLFHLAMEGNDAAKGGGIYVIGSDASIRHCSLSGNTADSGGGVFVDDASPTFDGCVLVGNEAGTGGGMRVDGTVSGAVTGSILAFNTGYNLYVDPSVGVPVVTYTDLYAPSGSNNHNLPGADATVLTVDPMFLASGSGGVPTDLHLAKGSPLINAGDPAMIDPDSSRRDIGLYGGEEGDDRDLDGDTFPDWFWPGTITDAPSGFLPTSYDCDDRNPASQACSS